MPELKNTFIRISSGRLVDLLNPQPEDIDLTSITRALNTIRRFTGHWQSCPPMTVAQHTLLTMEIAARIYPDDVETEFDCLLHDMPEAYYNDISSPMKRCIELKEFVDPIDKMLYDTLWNLDTPYNDEIKAKRKHCDLIALHIERNMMWQGAIEGNDDFLRLKCHSVRRNRLSCLRSSV